MRKGMGLVTVAKVESAKRKAFKGYVGKFLARARAAIKPLKHRSKRGVKETQEEGIERTRQLEIAQARFDAIRELHESI